MILRCASCACAIRLLVHRCPVRVLILHELLRTNVQLFTVLGGDSRSCKHDCCGKLEVRINDAIINWSTIRSIQRHADQQTKTVTQRQTEMDTQWETLIAMWQRFADRQTPTWAHIHWYHTDAQTQTHTPTPLANHTQTDGHTETWLRNWHPQYHRFLLTISESLIHAYLFFLFIFSFS